MFGCSVVANLKAWLQQLNKFSPHGSWESRGQLLLCFCVASSGIVISSPKKLEALNQLRSRSSASLLLTQDSDKQGHPILTLCSRQSLHHVVKMPRARHNLDRGFLADFGGLWQQVLQEAKHGFRNQLLHKRWSIAAVSAKNAMCGIPH
eukprot:s2963_g11.t1